VFNGAALLISASGRVRNTASAPTANEVVGAVGFNQGLLSIDINSPQRVTNGLPFNSAGKLSCQTVGSPQYSVNGVPINEFGCVAIDLANPIETWINGVPFTAAGRLAFDVAETPTELKGFSNGFSAGFK
jgi:hypothetical protein